MSNPATRALKWIAIALAALLFLLVAAAAGLWWWAGTQSSLDWTLRRIAKSEHLTAEGVEGSLRTGVRAKHLAWEKDGLAVEAFDADLAWQPLELLHTTVKLDHLHAARLRFEDHRPPKPSKMPVSLLLPVNVIADDIRVGQVEWIAAANSFAASDIAGRYVFDSGKHRLELSSLHWAGGSYQGRATLAATGNMEVDARLQGSLQAPVPGSKTPVPVQFNATATGPLAAMQANAVIAGDSVAGGATATARITPWEPQPVPEAHAQFRDLDLSKIWAAAPATLLTGTAAVQPAGTGTWAIEADVANASAGAWDLGQLPLERLAASGQWAAGHAVVKRLAARVGGGEVRGEGEWRADGPWALKAQVTGVDPSAVHSEFAALPLTGPVKLDGNGKVIAFDVALRAKTGKQVPPDVLALESAEGRGRWTGKLLSLARLEVRASDATLSAVGDVVPADKSGQGRLKLVLPGAQLEAEGRIGATTGAGSLKLAAADLRQALDWAGRVPGVPAGIAGGLHAGRADLQGTWQGGWKDPRVRAELSGTALQWGDDPATAWIVRTATARVEGRLSEAAWRLQAEASQGDRHVMVGSLGLASHNATTNEWKGRAVSLDLGVTDPRLGPGAWTLASQKGFDFRWAKSVLELGAGSALLHPPPSPKAAAPAQLDWDPVRWGGGELRTAGRITGLPLAWIELVGGPQLAGSAVTGDMVFDAQWQAQLGATPVLRASIARSRGDVTLLAETAEGVSTRVQAGVRQARVTVASEGDRVTATFLWDSEHGGKAEGRVSTRLARDPDSGWTLPDTAPLSGEIHARLPRIGVWSLLAPPGWRLRGSMVADVAIAGTKGDPQLSGTITADDLALRSVVDGIELQKGRLRARLEGKRVVIQEFMLHGPGDNGGTVTATGEGHLGANGPEATMTATLQKLRASIRVDRQLTVSGTVAAKRDSTGTVLNGNLRVDEALILLPEGTTPKLGDDVVVRNAAGVITKAEARKADAAARPAAKNTRIGIDIDLGNDFHVQGKGIDTRLRGTVAVSGDSIAAPRLVGTIRAGGGEYNAYGQRLEIERGIIRFTGAPDNPALDILAIRPNITQRVGVMVTGTAFFPFVRLYSEPDLPDAEKLSWLVTGRAAPATGAESALVQRAALAFLAGRAGSGKGGFAATMGLDELSFRRDAADGPSITLGKRFGRNFYAAYERSLAGALGTLSIFYDVTRNFTVRAQAGERSAVDLIYTLTFD